MLFLTKLQYGILHHLVVKTLWAARPRHVATDRPAHVLVLYGWSADETRYARRAYEHGALAILSFTACFIVTINSVADITLQRFNLMHGVSRYQLIDSSEIRTWPILPAHFKSLSCHFGCCVQEIAVKWSIRLA